MRQIHACAAPGTSRRTAAWWGIVSGLLLILTACLSDDPRPTDGFKEQVQTVAAALEQITPEIKSFGTISYYTKADVIATTAGVVDKLGAEEGAPVKSGQVLTVIDNIQLELQKKRTESQITQARSALELSEAKLKEAKLQVEARLASVRIAELDLVQKKKELDDAERLLKNKEQVFSVGGLSEEGIHSMRMQFEAQKSRYDLAVKSLEMQKIGLRNTDITAAGYAVPAAERERIEILKTINTQTLGAEVRVAAASLAAAMTELEAVNQILKEATVRSPLSGLVGMRYVELGERVQPDAKLYTVIDTSRAYAVFPVAEQEAGFVAENMPVEVVIDALGKARLEARVQLISPLVDPQTGNITVKAVLPNARLTLKPGMFARVRVITGASREAVLIPKSSLAKKEGNRGEVYTVVRGRIFLNKVQVGIEKEDRVEIVSGLSAGAAVVDAPSPLLREGQDVEVKNN